MTYTYQDQDKDALLSELLPELIDTGAVEINLKKQDDGKWTVVATFPDSA